MAEKNIFGLPPREDNVSASIKSLEKQRENLEKRLRAEGIDPDTLGGDFDNRNLLEKALNLTPDQGVLLDFFEVINRPLQAVKGAMTAGYEGKAALQGALEGLSGKKKTTGREVLGAGQKIDFGSPFANLVADLGADIFLDPLTYLPAGFFAKGFKRLSGRTKTRIFQTAQMKQDKFIRLLKNRVTETTTLEQVLEQEFRNGKSSQVFKFLKDKDGNFLDDLVKFVKGKTVKVGKEATPFTFGKQRPKILSELIETAPGETIKDAIAKGEYILSPQAKAAAAMEGFKNKYNPINKTINYLEQRLNTIASKALDPSGVQLTELNGVKRLRDIIAEFGPDYKVIATSTKNQLDDVIILKRYGATDYFTNVGSIEAKYIGDIIESTGRAPGAFGKNIDFVLEKTANRTRLAFGQNSPFLQTEVGERILNGLRTIRTTNGQTLESIFIAQKFGNNKSFKLLERVVKADREKLKMLLYDVYKSQGMDILYAAGKEGDGLFFRLDDVLDDIDLVSEAEFLRVAMKKKEPGAVGSAIESLGLAPKEGIRLKGGFNIDLNKVVEKGNVLLKEDIAEMFIQKSMNVRVSVLDDIAAKGGFFGATAKGLKNAFSRIGSALSQTFDFSDAAKRAHKFIIGESNLFVQRNSARLTTLKNEAIEKYGPRAGRLISELTESGAYVDEATGAIRTIDSTQHIDDFMEYVEGVMARGSLDFIPIHRFASTNHKNRFLSKLNDLAGEIGIGGADNPVFDVVQQGNATKLVINDGFGDLKTIQNIRKYIKQRFASGVGRIQRSPFLKYGNIKISKEAADLLRTDPQLVSKMQSLMDDIVLTLAKEGGFRDILPALAGNQGYVRHIMTKQAYELAQTSGVGAISRMAKPGTDVLKSRKYAGTLEELNAGFREFMNLDFDFFDTNIFNSAEDLIKLTSRKVEQHKVLKLVLTAPDRFGKSLFRVVDNTNEVRKGLGVNEVMIKGLDDELPALFKNLSTESRAAVAQIFDKRKILDGNKAVVINRNALGLLKRAERAYKDIPELIKMYDGFLNTWKGLTLITPGFHMRNLFGNMFNSYAVGMNVADQSKYGLIAMNELNEFNRLVKKVAQDGLDSLTVSEKKIYDMVELFNRQGLVQSHRGVRDLEQLKQITEQAVKGGALKNTYNNAIRFNFNIAEKMDDVQRYMLYRWSLDKTGDAAQAARTVTEALFDYTHLSGFEKDVMKRVFPFYTFMKNNFIFQAKNIIRNPKLYARTGRAYKYYLEDIAGYSPENLPDYATENMWLPIPIQVKKSDKKAIAFLKANLPLSDFMEIVENPFKKGVVSIAAPIKLPIELGLGRDLFTNRKITAFPGQRNVLQKGSGVFNFLRDERGNLTVTQMPIVQKIAAEIGLRTPLNFGSAGLDVLDTLLGYQGPQEGLSDFAARMGLAGVQDMDRLKLTELYQDLEKLREIKKYYEQETGYQLPLLPRG